MVWVNTRSRVYHCPGSPVYGTTAAGEYLAEAEARRLGNRPAGGRACTDSSGVMSQLQPRLEVVNPSGATAVLPAMMPAHPAGPLSPCELERIVDGDTIRCRGLGSVRLIGIDAPEGDQQAFGTAAHAGLAALVPLGATLQLEADVEPRDRYQRVLAYAWVGDSMVNWLLVRQGWAVSERFPPNLRYAEQFDAAEQAARLEMRGLWSMDGFRCRPVNHRRGAC